MMPQLYLYRACNISNANTSINCSNKYSFALLHWICTNMRNALRSVCTLCGTLFLTSWGNRNSSGRERSNRHPVNAADDDADVPQK